MISQTPLKILQIEDDPTDAELIQATLRSGGLDFEITRVDNEAGLLYALKQKSFDVVLADYRLPSLSGTNALKIVRSQAPDLPFILVTGTVGEEVAVETLKQGATDFVLKDSMARLGSAVLRAIEDSRKRKDLKQAENALRESEEKYRTLVERVPVIVYIAEPGHSGKWHYVSPRIESILGFTSAEWLEDPTLWFQQVLPEDRDKALSDDNPLSEVFISEYRMRKKNGEIAWFRDEAVSLQGDEGKPLIHGLMIDITDLKNAEAAKLSLEKRLRQIQKIEVLGQLAGGVAHDFNNILMVISSYCEILQLKLSTEDTNLKLIGEIRTAADRGAALTRQLLVFSRKQRLEPKIVDLNQIVTEMGEMLRHLIREDIELVVRLKEKLNPVKVDPGQIERLIINLIVNARDAMPKGGVLTIETSDVEIQQTPAWQQVEAAPGPYAVLTISDTGIGMDPDTLSRIFEPFFTTKEEGKGTGLGLSTAYGIVKQSGGQIEVSSEPGKGTTFRLLFPAHFATTF